MDILFSNEFFSLVALILTFIAFVPYIRAILREQTRPHVFSWFIWGGGTAVVFLAQLTSGAGVGAWPVGISSLITFFIAFLALNTTADKSIVTLDWLFLGLAFSALPLWLYTSSALSAVIVLTIVNLFGFGPSLRKAYALPFEENAMLFGVSAIRNGFVLAALEHYSWTTVLFPAAVAIACILFVGLILFRRRIVTLS